MTMEQKTNSYGSKKVILQFPDDYVAEPQFFDEQSTLAVKENGRYIIKAGTPFPSNDANAVGIVANDIDVTDGDANGAVYVRAHINTARAQANAGITYSSACKSALKNAIFFYPLGGTVAESTVIATTDTITSSDVDPIITITLEGTDFKPKQASGVLTNYTITPGDSGLVGKKVTRINDKTIKLQLEGTPVATKTIQIQAKAAAVVNDTASNTITLTIGS